jgi:signal transduction histidine kinase
LKTCAQCRQTQPARRGSRSPLEDGAGAGAGAGADAAFVLLHMRDRGPGVAPADLDTIFAPFYRSHPAANNVDGHGLGLAIARRVV